ncbi:alpha-glucosidase [Aphanothece hegewaldii CCALA 016]|uniref:Alpha-glucosidase n=1 Tax=Aphanothece hegewaldii CCALA 016 TaxID=2107694 RepID=A0A2T1LUW8_9CHRO|nr:glycoside hydrolase family 31 protein [Aphanothece hegewaldii]PSF35241.1 alpha-glucosidase [Aphanothece hegewaldii CCALA 016]
MPQYFGKLQTNEQPWSVIEPIKGIEKSAPRSGSLRDRSIDFHCGKSLFKISILAPNLIRVRLAPTGEFQPRRSWAVAKKDGDWDKTPFEVTETPENISIQTEQIKVTIERNQGRIECSNLLGQPFARDAEIGMGWHTGAVAGWKMIEPDEHFYGFGERTGLLDQRSEIKTNWTVDCIDYNSLTDEMYPAIPFFMALRPNLCYGIFLNSTYWSQFDIGVTKPGIWKMETRSPELDYYIIYGTEPSQVIQTYTELTGRMTLPPRWSLGYHQSRWGYDSEDVVHEIAQEFRNRQLPCDVIHLDIDYMRGFRVFTWSPKRFPHAEQLLSQLKTEGFKVVPIVDPGVKYEPEADYAPFDEGMKNDYFVRKPDGQLFHGYVWPDKALFPDFINPEVRKWWGESQKILTDAGVAGIWNDMNEPSMSDRPFGDKGQKVWFPLESLQGPADEQVTHAETHNIYGLMMVQACYDGLLHLRPNERPFLLTRSGYAGIQRWSSVWMGDNQATWEHLELSLPMLFNMGLSGVPFVGCDIGGFAGNGNAELFTRWLQVGMLYPFMRAHSAMSTARREPWVYGQRIEDICREYLNLRYRLIPYLYTLFWQTTQTGAPIFRPLLYDYPNDPKTYQLHDQILLGSSLMAAPVYRPGVEYRAVYLPDGVWYDWWTGTSYEGNSHILAAAPLETMPLYVKAGSIIPLYPVRQYIDEEIPSELTLKVFPGEGELTLYEDDGHTFEYQQQAWATTQYRVSIEGDNVIVDISPREGSLVLSEREIIVDVVDKGEQRFTDDGTARQLRF